MTFPCEICGGEPEVCAEVGHEWVPCPYCGEDTRPSFAICPTCQNDPNDPEVAP